jgi:hypothetical protein
VPHRRSIAGRGPESGRRADGSAPIVRMDEEGRFDPYLRPRSESLPTSRVDTMMISQILTVIGAAAGLLVLLLMAVTPLLLALPAPRPRPRPSTSATPHPVVVVPAQRAGSPAPARPGSLSQV